MKNLKNYLKNILSRTKYFLTLFSLSIGILQKIDCQNDNFQVAYFQLKDFLEKDTLPFKEAVFLVENTFLDNKNRMDEFNYEINKIKRLILKNETTFSIQYNQKDSQTIKRYAAIFKTITDTTKYFDELTFRPKEQLPFQYDFDDIFGSVNWENTFVTKLLVTKKGNCHSLPYLYKILCDEYNIPCHLALAPNHIYIKHRASKGGWYNTELTSASFPIDAWLMASGYISLQAVQNGIYLDTLSEKESIALCVLDLAQGYNHKYPDNDGKFVIECCDLALKHFPDYVSAILLKAETRLKQLQSMQKEMKYAYLKDVTTLPDGKAKWDEMNSLYMQLYKLGYRQMPEQMYVEWLTSLKTEKEKYSNKSAPGAMKD
jgi:hypothetical protein